MRTLLVCLIAFLLLSGAARALGSKGFLWKITSSTTSVYLLGSIHMGSQNLYPLNRLQDKGYVVERQ